MTSDTLTPAPYALATLIGSRICHDLISPIGAVNNGIELLTLSGATPSPELSLVAESVANANARIRFFRLAFGIASDAQMIGAEEVDAILRGVYSDGRITAAAFPEGSFPRADVRAVLLALLCAEQAVPYGGFLRVDTTSPNVWRITAEGDRLAPDPDLWGLLDGRTPPPALPPTAVQFLILPQLLPDIGFTCTTRSGEDIAEIRLSRE
ncbi:MAG: histidine phosphotransferase family protein [Pseudomonadota bacterium]